jgi:hypothetical protein
MAKEVIKGFKGFEKGLTCRGYQYEEGKEHVHEGNVKACCSGFHFCEYPLDCFEYYPPSTSVFHEVEGSGDIEKESDKTVSSVLKVGLAMTLKQLVEASIKFTFEKVKWDKKEEGDNSGASTSGDYSGASTSGNKSGASTSGNYSGASTSGNYSGASTSGDKSGASTSGDYSGASTSGYKSGASTSGDYSGASTSGNYSGASTSGYKSGASTSGNYSGASTSGDYSGASTSGYKSGASTSGDYSGASTSGNCSGASTSGDYSKVDVGVGAVGLAVGMGVRGKGKIGSWLVLTEASQTDYITYVKDVQVVKVDGEKIKADTWYKLVDGKFIETSDDNE